MSAVFLFVIEKHRAIRTVMNVWKFEMTHDVMITPTLLREANAFDV